MSIPFVVTVGISAFEESRMMKKSMSGIKVEKLLEKLKVRCTASAFAAWLIESCNPPGCVTHVASYFEAVPKWRWILYKINLPLILCRSGLFPYRPCGSS